MDIEGIENLRETPLPAGLIVKDVITDGDGRPKYDYEDWLRELINESDAFGRKTDGDPFAAPSSEAHGEDDACAKEYGIDFKIVVAQSLMQGLKEYSTQKTVLNGITLVHPSRREGSKQVLRLHAALRQLGDAELRRLWGLDPKRDSHDDEERDVAGFLKTLQKRKNLLLLYPMLLYTQDDAAVPKERVGEALYSDFKASILLRTEFFPKWDNYLAYVMDGRLVIIVVDECGWKHFDDVPLNASPTLMDVLKHYEPYEYPHLRKMVPWL